MSQSTADYEIEITVRSTEVTVKTAQGGEGRSLAERDDLRRETIELFESWLNQKRKMSNRREFVVLGRHLFEFLFKGEVLSVFEGQLRQARESKGRLRVQLSFHRDVADLASWPWEYLYYAPETGRGFFLCTEVDLVLSRYIPLRDPRPPLKPDAGSLRLLIVISQPQDLNPVLAEPVVEVIEEMAAERGIEIARLDKPTPGNFVEHLTEIKPHVLHYIGHGRFNKEHNQAEIALLKPDESSNQWIRDSVFADFFHQTRAVPRLVLLHLCEGGVVDFEDNFAGLAPQLILTGVQAVVAMQHPIENWAAISFSRAFYRELAQGHPVDQAVQQARYWITIDQPSAVDDRVFGTPVLYLHSRDGIILPARSEPVAGRGGATGAVRSEARAPEQRPAPATAPESRRDQMPPSQITSPAPAEGRPDGRILAPSGMGERISPAGATPGPQTAVPASQLRLSRSDPHRIPTTVKLRMRERARAIGAGEGCNPDEIAEIINGLDWKSGYPDMIDTLKRLQDEAFSDGKDTVAIMYEGMYEALMEWVEDQGQK